jgi:hypothetical protein
MDGTQPILPVPTIAALPAWNNIFAHRVIAEFQSIFFASSLTQGNDFTHKFVPRSHRRLAQSMLLPDSPFPEGAAACGSFFSSIVLVLVLVLDSVHVS